MKEMRIVYMGTPEFAVAPLRRLVEGGYTVVGVVTGPDRPAGRGHRVQQSAVKQYALSVGLPILQPERLRDEAFLTRLADWHADLQVVVAFRMLPEAVWAMPRLGTFNLHASLLPQYRGAAPINHALINGETTTGVTTFFLNREIDTGAIISQVQVPILDSDDAGTLHDRLMTVGAQAVVDTVDRIAAGTAAPTPQIVPPGTTLHTAPKLFPDTCRIDWNQSATAIRHFVRGLSPYPAARADLCLTGTPQTVKIFEVDALPADDADADPGTIDTDGRTYIHIATADGTVAIRSLQWPGRRRMATDELLRGLRTT